MAVAGGLTVVVTPAVALADTGPSFDLATDSRALLDAPYGAISIGASDTDRYGGSGPCPTSEDPDGYAHGALFSVTSAASARLMVNVTDDLDGSLSVCRVALLVHERDGATFSDPFDAAQRSTFGIAATDDCASSSSCTLDRVLEPGRTYHLAVYAATPPGGHPAARFSIAGSLRQRVSLRTTVTGHRLHERCSGIFEIIAGRQVRITVRSTPAVDGAVLMRTFRPSSGGWEQIASTTVALSAGRATISHRARSGEDRVLLFTVVGTDEIVGTGLARVRSKAVTPRWRRSSEGVRLSVRYYRQQHRLSCEAATLRMAHNYHHAGRIDRDMDVYRITGIERYRRPARAGGCNPDRAFCGRVNGRMMRDGYGVHAGPIARAATRYDRCRPALLLRDYSTAAIARHIDDGFPVIVWGAHRGATGIYRYRWRAWDGHRVTAYSVEHTWVVIGFRGPVSSPTRFIIHDPSRGASRVVTRSQFRSFTRYFETAVVVRG